ncbi:MAG: peptidoglycan DD-metalloendopeptidase family protein [Xanthomonadales bacterium]|nr:peptidoglycan DD-metalloendopeptidase family protein [Xanthomonadales bacterium]
MPDGIRVHRWIAVALVALSLAACGRAPSPPDAATAAAPAAAAPPIAATAAPIRETTRTVVPGDTLERIFRDEGLAPSELAALRADPDLRRRIDRIVPGDELRLRIDDGRLLAFERRLSATETLRAERAPDGSLRSELRVDPLEHSLRTPGAVIEGSLFQSADLAGISDATAFKIAGIFRWDIDFVLDIRPGDRFDLTYETLSQDGVPVGDGELLAVQFINQGQTYRAVRWTPPGGTPDYFTPDGRSLRKAFLRAPLEFSRVSSRFNLYRRHPILNRMRAHRGVDYAAPIGTPVRAAGGGRVAFVGIKGGYGNVIEIVHPGGVRTVYGHLSRFSRGLRSGTVVEQGRVIGHVGMTGLATGPHLHYEYLQNGVHKDPQKVPLPKAEPVPARHMAAFRAHADPLLAGLDASVAAGRTAPAQTTASTGAL